MLTLFKKIFTWWNQDTFGTRLKTIFFGKLAGTDQFGNKYYEDKKGKRWVIYSDVIDASKIPVEWYSWIHFTPNKIEKKHELEKYDWQKPHQSNLTGTEKAYYPNKNKENPQGDFGIRQSKLNLSGNIKYTYSGLSCVNLNSLKNLTVRHNKLGQLYRDWAIKEFLSGEVYYGNWIDVGTHERLQEARSLVKNQT